jgi:hypothetical protein
LDNIRHRLNREREMTTDVDVDMTADMDVDLANDMAADMDVDVTADMDDDGPCIFGPISNVAQIF